MTEFSNFGIYEGGEVNKLGANLITIDPYFIYGYSVSNNGYVTGEGRPFDDTYTYAKKIEVVFTTDPTEFAYLENINDPQIPRLVLNINRLAAGSAIIYYNEHPEIANVFVHTDVNNPLPVGTIKFARLSWPANTTDLNLVTIDTSGPNRTESYMAKSIGPTKPDGLHYDGQYILAGGKNGPLANFSIFAQVLQSEALLSFGQEYFVTFTKPADIVSNNLTVDLHVCRHIARRANEEYVTFDTKGNSGIAKTKTFGTIGEVQGQVIYITINKTTGAPDIKLSYDQNTEYLIAYGDVPFVATNLNGVTWRIVNNLGGQVLLVDNLSEVIRSTKGSGFLRPLQIVESQAQSSIRLKANVLNIDGYPVHITEQEIALPAPPTNGKREDFIYLEVVKNAIPWVALSYQVKVVSNAEIKLYPDPFAKPGFIVNGQSNPYTYSANGNYEAVDTTNAIDNKSYAIPIAVVRRMNTEAFSDANQNGGLVGTRFDGKQALFIANEDIENRAPIANFENSNEMLGRTIVKLLEGSLNNRLKPGLLDPDIMSREHYQVDRVGSSGVMPGSTFAGKADGLRYRWSRNNYSPIQVYGLIKEDIDSGIGDYAYPNVVYDTDTKTLALQVPVGVAGEISRSSASGDPLNINIRWVATGQEVEFSSIWSVGDLRVTTNVINVAGLNYIPGGEIAIMFSINYQESVEEGLSKIPARLIGAALNNDFNTLSNSLALSSEKDAVPRKVKNMSRFITVLSSNYYDELFIERSGSPKKFHTYEYRYKVAGNASSMTDYLIDDTITDGGGIYGFVGVLRAYNQTTGASIPLAKLSWEYSSTSKFRIRLSQAVPVDQVVVIVFACAGQADKQLDLSYGSMQIGSILQASTIQITANQVSNQDGVYRYSSGKIITGVSSSENQYIGYVGDDAVTVQVFGIATNLITLDFSRDSIAGLNSSNWFMNGLGKYVPASNVSLRLPELSFYKMEPTDQIYIRYIYNADPFIPFKPAANTNEYRDYLSEARLPYPSGKSAEIIHPGKVILTNDAPGNTNYNYYSPVTEKFPVVQGVTNIGTGVVGTTIGVNDTTVYETVNSMIESGIPISFDDKLYIRGNTAAGTGLAILATLIRQLNLIRLFVYICADGELVLNNPSQAFVVELEYCCRGIVNNG